MEKGRFYAEEDVAKLLLFSIFYVTGCVNAEEEASTRSIPSIDETAGEIEKGKVKRRLIK
ncbi:hypothetical protein [Thalassobacillus sp. C254]|uniref:hypothetical protein n=1 Tax=Thalassobacillus sp. C254 TaxID=1225341 RepID=UPI0006D1F0FE|nr:hypothetical protein [Thalassobacillus sp. C254]